MEGTPGLQSGLARTRESIWGNLGGSHDIRERANDHGIEGEATGVSEAR